MKTVLIALILINCNNLFSQKVIKIDAYNCYVFGTGIDGGTKAAPSIRNISSKVNNWLYLIFEENTYIEKLEVKFPENIEFQSINYEIRINGILDTMNLKSNESEIEISTFVSSISINTIYPSKPYLISSFELFSSQEKYDISFDFKTRIDKIEVVEYYNVLQKRVENEESNRKQYLKEIYNKTLRKSLRKDEKKKVSSLFKSQKIPEICTGIYDIIKNRSTEFQDVHQILYNTEFCWCNYTYSNSRFGGCYFQYGFKMDSLKVLQYMNEYYGTDLTYRETVDSLEKQVLKGDGYASMLLCMLQSKNSLEKIYQLKFIGRPHSQFLAVQSHIYFREHEIAMEITENMINIELQSLQTKSISKYGRHAVDAVFELFKFYPDQCLDYLLLLYKAYMSVYPCNFDRHNFFYENELTEKELKTINSVSGADQIIEFKLLENISKYDFLKENDKLEELTKEIKKYYP